MINNNPIYNDMQPQQESNGKWIAILVVAKLLCCGLPILLLSGVALSSISANWLFIVAAVIISALISFIWLKRRKNRRLSCADANGICISKAPGAKIELV